MSAISTDLDNPSSDQIRYSVGFWASRSRSQR